MLDRDWLTTVGGAIHANKLRHGWKVTGRGAFESDPEQVLAVLMLVVTEVAEAAEAVRKTDELNFREELADIVIRVIGLAHGMGIDMRAEILAKVEKNSTREHKHGGKRV
jgi:NTP pyrophosphatase (non-canonical NTP hydrolase)